MIRLFDCRANQTVDKQQPNGGGQKAVPTRTISQVRPEKNMHAAKNTEMDEHDTIDPAE